jgi:uncharacterized lipoprotein YehR (DUF1307 family)
MKQMTWLVAVMVALAFTLVGCGKQESGDTSKAPTNAVEKAKEAQPK